VAKYFAMFLTIIFLAGCDKKIYTKIYDEKEAKKPISCLNIKSDNLLIEDVIKKSPFIKKLYKKECPVVLKITSHYVTSCSSARAKALGSDFDGFVRFEIIKNEKLVYRNQRDFKGSFTQDTAETLIKRLKKDLNFIVP